MKTLLSKRLITASMSSATPGTGGKMPSVKSDFDVYRMLVTRKGPLISLGVAVIVGTKHSNKGTDVCSSRSPPLSFPSGMPGLLRPSPGYAILSWSSRKRVSCTMTPSISSCEGNLFCVLGMEKAESVRVVTTLVGSDVGQVFMVGNNVGTAVMAGANVGSVGENCGARIIPAAKPPATMAPPAIPPTIPPTTAGRISLFLPLFRRPLSLRFLCFWDFNSLCLLDAVLPVVLILDLSDRLRANLTFRLFLCQRLLELKSCGNRKFPELVSLSRVSSVTWLFFTLTFFLPRIAFLLRRSLCFSDAPSELIGTTSPLGTKFGGGLGTGTCST
jgi:hypothetical protein